MGVINLISDLIELQRLLKANNIWFFQFYSYRDLELKIIGSFDFAYYHNVEITFHEVSFISSATDFSHAKLRYATDNEKEELFNGHSIPCEENDFVFCFTLHEELYGNSCDKYFIVAEGLDFIFEDVFYYKRDNLQKGQRIAEWVK